MKQDYLHFMNEIIYCTQIKLLRQWSQICVHNRNCGFMRTYIPCYIESEDKSSRLQTFFKIGILKSFLTTVLQSLSIELRAWRPVLESLFNNVAGLHVCNVIKRDSNTGFLCDICEIYKNTFFTEHLQWFLLWREGFLKKENFWKHDWIKKGPNF